MKKRLLAVLIGVVLILTLASSSVSAAKPAGGVGAGPLFHWRYQSSVTASNVHYWLEEERCNLLNIATGGRLYVDLLPTGALCTGFEALDATMTGSVELTTS